MLAQNMFFFLCIAARWNLKVFTFHCIINLEQGYSRVVIQMPGCKYHFKINLLSALFPIVYKIIIIVDSILAVLSPLLPF